ncbi:MAG TPA: hypothetical protein DEA08_25815 [Planctomycetes bacterium]|nr:hypothetical protein [Planctomycetota bacterium]
MRRFLAPILLSACLCGCPAPEGGPQSPGGEGAPPSSASETQEPSADPSPEPSAEPDPEGEASPAPLVRPPTETKPGGLQVGQRYHFRVVPKQGITVDEVWTITSVSETEVRYDLRSVNRMEEVAGMPESPPVEFGPTPKVFILSREDVPLPPGEPPTLAGEETLDISGRSFPCQVFAKEGTKQWISALFPREIKIEHEGRPFRWLVKVEAP